MNYYIMYFSLREVLSPRVNKHTWEAAMKYLKETNDDAGWHVMMYGA
jgi:hypothetical protein